MKITEAYVFDGSRLTLIEEASHMQIISTEEDDYLFVIKGKYDEVYFIEDLTTLRRLQEILSTQPSKEASKMMLQIVNPEKYPNG